MIISYHQLGDVPKNHPDKKIILTSGTYDLFHVGHVRYLSSARRFGDLLIVMLSSDDRVRSRKGAGRPVIPETDRAEILDALRVVDYVFIDPGKVMTNGEPDPVYKKMIEDLMPDLYVTDGDDPRLNKLLPRSRRVILPRQTGGRLSSTTAIVERVLSLNNES